jgi:hypothetical protein
MTERKVKTSLSLATVVFPLLGFFSLCGCNPGEKGKDYFLETSLKKYADAKLSQQPSALLRPGVGTPLFFPTLDLYDREGNLIYSHDPMHTPSDVFSHLLEDLNEPRPIEGSSNFKDFIKALDRGSAVEIELSKRHKSTLVSISESACEACSVRAEELAQAKRRILRQGIDIVNVQVDLSR